MRILIASGNPHKITEIQTLLSHPGIEWVTPADLPCLATDVEEVGKTFEENAVLKACTLALRAGCHALADDSGLEVDALKGDPGVRSARYSGIHGDDAANNRLLLKNLEGISNRSARFRCAIALTSPDGTVVLQSEGVCEGSIAPAESGKTGFGYDPLFIPEGYSSTFAELGERVKNQLSHRARALAALASKMHICGFPIA